LSTNWDLDKKEGSIVVPDSGKTRCRAVVRDRRKKWGGGGTEKKIISMGEPECLTPKTTLKKKVPRKNMTTLVSEGRGGGKERRGGERNSSISVSGKGKKVGGGERVPKSCWW